MGILAFQSPLALHDDFSHLLLNRFENYLAILSDCSCSCVLIFLLTLRRCDTYTSQKLLPWSQCISRGTLKGQKKLVNSASATVEVYNLGTV
jgi:hypothetical protein